MVKTPLSMLQKKKICLERDRRRTNGENISLTALAEWAKTNFNMNQAPSRSTLSRTFRQSENLLSQSDRSISKKIREKKGKNHALEMALFEWVCQQHHEGKKTDGESIKRKAGQLQSNYNEKVPEDKQSNLSFSAGWLENFRKRWQLRTSKPSEGPAGSPDEDATTLQGIVQSLNSYQPQNIFNADEFGLFYRLTPDKRLAAANAPSPVAPNERMAVMLCCNADGSEKVPPMVIGTSSEEHKKKKGQLVLEYRSNGKAWMTSVLFRAWLESFQRYIARTPGRQALLLIDKNNVHGSPKCMPEYPNIRVLFLPSNENSQSEIQPLRAGVIDNLKLRYRLAQMERAMDNTDIDSGEIFKLDIATTLKLLRFAWMDMPVSCVVESWKRTPLRVLLDTSELSHGEVSTCHGEVSTPENEQNELKKRLGTIISDLVPSRYRLSLGELIAAPGEDQCTQVATEAELLSYVLDVNGDSVIREEDGEGAPDVLTCSPKEQLKSIALCKRIAENFGLDDCVRELRKVQAAVRHELA